MSKPRPPRSGACQGGACFLFSLLLLFFVPYVALTDLTGRIPAAFLTQALDDDGDGAADAGVWDQIATDVGDEIDGTLGQRYATPFTAPLPAIVKDAAKIFAAEAIYARRVSPEQNPFTARASALRTKLAAIGQGEQPLTPETGRKQPSASAITEPAKTFSRRDRLRG